MTSYTFRKSNTSKGSSAKSFLIYVRGNPLQMNLCDVESRFNLESIDTPEYGDRRLFIEHGSLPKPGTWSFFDCATTDAALGVEGVLFMDGEKLQPLLVT
ncbi:hypothetical protein TNCV_1203811 [Trichonephila clavipes]|nr:hypothetical protein TNCV_1203811 [Trichonephila clavipes]